MKTSIRLSALAAAVVALAAVAPTAQAQSSASASINATGTVLSPLSVVAGQSLAFGKVGQNVAKTIAPDDATSGRFIVQGQGAAKVDITLTLPTNLTSGANTLAIGTWTGAFGFGNDAAGGTAFTPVSGVAVNRTLPGLVTDAAQRIFYRLGAKVTPTAAQAAGDYTGAIQLNAIYTEI